MGHDRVLTVFSQHHPTLFKYLQQTFAEVTNPPIDPYREGGAMSLATYLGRGPLTAGRPQGDDGTARPADGIAVARHLRRDRRGDPAERGARVQAARRHLPASGRGRRAAGEPASRSRARRRRRSTTATTSCASRDKEACKRGIVPDPVAARPRGGPPVPVPPGAARQVHPHRAGRRHPGRARRLLPRRLRGRRGSPVPDAPARQGRADVQGPGHEAGVQAASRARRSRTCSRRWRTRIKKMISKMGITTIEGYRGAQLFEAVGFGPDLMEFLGDFPSRARRHRLRRVGGRRAVARRSRPRR